MNNFSFKLLSISLIILILFVFAPNPVEAGPVVIIVAVVVAATAVYDYVSCDINVLWGGCGGNNGGGGGGGTPPPPTPTADISVVPSLIERGQSATLTWSSSDADSCRINWIGNVNLSGSQAVSPEVTKEYTLTCDGSGGSVSDSVTLLVKWVDLLINNSNNTLNQPLSLWVPNTDAKLSWTSSEVNSCSASGNWSGNKPVSGSEELGSLQRGTENPGSGKKYIYTLTCDSFSDTVSALIWQYPRCSFSADPSSIILPQSSTLSWSCSYASSCSIDQRVGSVNDVGSQEV